MPTPAGAGDGRIEINQAKIVAAGGFPYTVSQPGSYVLTSDLDVPAGSDGLQFMGNDFALDLNGFRISGNATCVLGNCTPGSARGVYHFPSVALGRRISVRNGTIQGFSGNCLTLALDARVSDLLVTQCGGQGIAVGAQSLVVGNRVTLSGATGLALGADSAYSNNVVSGAGLATGAGAVEGGLATTGNVCDDGTCGFGARRFYLTTGTFLGADADEPGTCAPGFHFASRWELEDVGSLRYDPGLGVTIADSGSGPPAGGFGWMRFAISGAAPPCGLAGIPWSQNATTGTAGRLSDLGSPWEYTTAGPCGIAIRVWCIQD